MTTSTTTPCTHHSLEGTAFQAALERYVDENKPDPLVLQQIQAWEMEWNTDDALTTTSPDTTSLEPTDWLQGTLTWKSDYMVAQIDCSSCWNHKKDDDDDDKDKNKQGLYFVLKATLRFRTKHDNKHNKDDDNKDKKANDKIRTKMIQRLRQDDYIKKLLSSEEQNDNKDWKMLCEARVSIQQQQQPSSTATATTTSVVEQLEERVDVNDAVAEGLRRALFSASESSLDVIEVLLSLPLLPGSAHTLSFDCPLADRAKLRLLEDAMFDACEREGEEELIDDLKISTANNNDNSNKDESEEPPSKGGGGRPVKQQKTTKQQPNNRSNKRTKR
ncbi:expressed unknown protein [Seminavis robusta]|uniref:Uncharacterized protein n=1 Tax=Seminavis robusta TaxID=568900 RepID=A0A9N8ERI2_9STRA|nr:expressed unknown protein [Seminavis robusta]|eukprot:Sro1504_g278080.1 n/a (331) ;mRNA; f:5482-6474